MISVHMKRGEMPKQPTVRTGRYFVSEERFNNSVTTLVSIEYNRNLCIVFLFMRCFSCHQMAVTSASAVLRSTFTVRRHLGGRFS